MRRRAVAESHAQVAQPPDGVLFHRAMAIVKQYLVIERVPGVARHCRATVLSMLRNPLP
jgi:hypothetical protein